VGLSEVRLGVVKRLAKYNNFNQALNSYAISAISQALAWKKPAPLPRFPRTAGAHLSSGA